MEDTLPASPLFVSTGWLAANLEATTTVPVDVRPPFFFTQGHVPQARNLPHFFLQGPTGGPPTPEFLSARLQAAGITPQMHLVAYDDGANAHAARLLWLLHFYRHLTVSVLDGGFARWELEDRPLDIGTPLHPTSNYAVRQPDIDVLASTDAVLAMIGTPETVVVDVRSPAEYLGLQATAQRNGHIPGAINIDWTNNLESADGQAAHSKSDADLRLLYESAGVLPDKEIIVHCQTGVRASYTYAVLRRLGYKNVRNYARGWQEWGNRSDTPVESR